MNKNDKPKVSPEERVERMNGIFDRLILPMILFTIAVFVGFAVIPKLADCASCGGKQPSAEIPSANEQTDSDFYSMRAILLDDEECLSLFEAAGYTLMESGGSTVAYRQLDSGVMIIENLRDSNGQPYSAICLKDEQKGTDTTIMLYSSSIFLVLVDTADGSVSAIFDNDEFLSAPSAADAEQEAVLALVSSAALSSMTEQYKEATLAVAE